MSTKLNLNASLDRRGFVAALGAAGALALAGCGSSKGGASASDAEAAYTLVEEGKIIVASDLANPPLDYVENNQNKGFEVELMEAVAEKLGLTCEYLPAMKFDAIIPLIKQGGKADVGVSNFTITDERKAEIDFSDPYLDSNQGVVTRADAEKDSADTLNADGVKIACQSGTTGETWAQENLPLATIVSLDDPVQAVTGVSTGLYDAAAADLPVMSYLCSQSFTDCKVAIEVPTGEQYGIVVSKDNPGLTQKINDALAELEADGTIADLQIKWFGAEV
ncbi:MAG: ABC transporter substrate-binding protein [Coriobacteriia bacterium]|nr:ABC transporter substrate-binding protein [Coriobacteriia bacterium]